MEAEDALEAALSPQFKHFLWALSTVSCKELEEILLSHTEMFAQDLSHLMKGGSIDIKLVRGLQTEFMNNDKYSRPQTDERIDCNCRICQSINMGRNCNDTKKDPSLQSKHPVSLRGKKLSSLPQLRELYKSLIDIVEDIAKTFSFASLKRHLIQKTLFCLSMLNDTDIVNEQFKLVEDSGRVFAFSSPAKGNLPVPITIPSPLSYIIPELMKPSAADGKKTRELLESVIIKTSKLLNEKCAGIYTPTLDGYQRIWTEQEILKLFREKGVYEVVWTILLLTCNGILALPINKYSPGCIKLRQSERLLSAKRDFEMNKHKKQTPEVEKTNSELQKTIISEEQFYTRKQMESAALECIRDEAPDLYELLHQSNVPQIRPNLELECKAIISNVYRDKEYMDMEAKCFIPPFMPE